MAKIRKIFIYLKHLKPYGFWPGFVVGIFYFSWIFFWLWNLYPLAGFGISNGPLSFLIISILFSIGVAGMSLFWGLFSYYSFYFIKNHNRPMPLSLYLAGIFVFFEYFRSFFFGILWFGNGSYLGPHWTLGNIAYLFSNIEPIIKTSSIWGIYGIEFLTVYLLSSLILYTTTRRWDGKNILLGILLLLLVIFATQNYLVSKQEAEKVQVSLVQTRWPSKINYDQDEFLVDFQNKLSLVQRSVELLESSNNLGLIILPEGANFVKTLSIFMDDAAIKNYFERLSKKELFLVDQFRADEGSGLKSKTAVISSKSGLIATYDKRLLTPTGEFIPYILKLPLFIASRLANFELPLDFYSGHEPSKLDINGKKVKIVVCSELLSPSLVSEQNADFIIALHNFGLFNGGRLLEKQVLAMSRFRAVENGKYSVTSSNYGQSYIINPEGQTEKMAQGLDYELLTGLIVPNKTRTWYNYVGDWPILIISSVIFGVGIKKNRDDTKS